MIAALLLIAAAAPATGVDEPPRRGTYAETSLGIFTAMGGNAPLSNAQAYIGMTLGHDLGERGTVFASLAVAGVSASCFQKDPKSGAFVCPPAPDSFGTIFGELGASYGMNVALRTLLSIKLVGGVTDFSPGPFTTNNLAPNHTTGLHVGGGVSLDYDTHLDHFAVGIDALLRCTFATTAIPSLAVMPRIRYVF